MVCEKYCRRQKYESRIDIFKRMAKERKIAKLKTAVMDREKRCEKYLGRPYRVIGHIAFINGNGKSIRQDLCDIKDPYYDILKQVYDHDRVQVPSLPYSNDDRKKVRENEAPTRSVVSNAFQETRSHFIKYPAIFAYGLALIYFVNNAMARSLSLVCRTIFE